MPSQTDPQTSTNPSQLGNTFDLDIADTFLHTDDQIWTPGGAPTSEKDEDVLRIPSARAVVFVKTWISQSPGCFPSGEDIASLAKLAASTPQTIKNIFGQILQGSYPEAPLDSDLTLNHEGAPNPQGLAISNGTEQSSIEVTEPMKAANWVAKQTFKCKPQKHAQKGTVLAVNLNEGHPRKYECTLSCHRTFARKDVWKKHEALCYPQEGWVCTLEPCVRKALGRGRIFYRRDHFVGHFDRVHHGIPYADHFTQNHFVAHPIFDRTCKFCTAYLFSSWQDRVEHLASHFESKLHDSNNDHQSSRADDESGLLQEDCGYTEDEEDFREETLDPSRDSHEISSRTHGKTSTSARSALSLRRSRLKTTAKILQDSKIGDGFVHRNTEPGLVVLSDSAPGAKAHLMLKKLHSTNTVRGSGEIKTVSSDAIPTDTPNTLKDHGRDWTLTRIIKVARTLGGHFFGFETLKRVR